MTEVSNRRVRKRLIFWSVATGVQAFVLIAGLIATEYIEVELYEPRFTAILLISVFVLAPLMFLAPLSAIFAIVYAVKHYSARHQSR